jgi:hypothetical protein
MDCRFEVVSIERAEDHRDFANYTLVFFGFAFVFIYTEAFRSLIETVYFSDSSVLGLMLDGWWMKVLFITAASSFFCVHAWCAAYLTKTFLKTEFGGSIRTMLRFAACNWLKLSVLILTNGFCIVWPFLYLAGISEEPRKWEEPAGYIVGDIALLTALVLLGIYYKKRIYGGHSND